LTIEVVVTACSPEHKKGLPVINVVLAIVALAVSVYGALAFFKAGRFKATASRETLLQAGFGWVERIPTGLVRVIAWLEILGAIGVVLAPLAAYVVPALGFAQWVGVAAAFGLALTMVGAAAVHIARKEFAYTWKMNTRLFLVAVIAGVLQALVTLPVLA
jgi:hypothetical protein